MAFYREDCRTLFGVQEPLLYHPYASLGEVLVHYLRKTPDKITQVCCDDGVEISCGEMADMTVNVAKNLMKLGLKTGDTIGIVGKNVTHATPTIFGCYLLGCPISPLESTMQHSEFISTFRITNPKIIFCDSGAFSSMEKVVKELNKNIEVVTLTEKVEGVRHVTEFFVDPGKGFELPRNAFKASETCATILRTTGTTEEPKTAKISHAQLLHPLTVFGNDPDIFGFSFSLYSWVTCSFLTVNAVIKHEKRLITSKTFDADVFFDLLEKYKFTHFLTAPGHYRILMQSPRYENADFSSLKRIGVGGWYVSEELRRTIQNKIPKGHVMVGGGMTEIGGALFEVYPNDAVSTAIGKPLTNTEMKVLMDDGSFGGFNDVGEVLVKRPDRFLGYINNDVETAKTIDADGWLYTGDVGYFDENFNVTLIGRKAFMIRCMQKILQPSELEDLIEKVPGVRDVCVVGVPVPSLGKVPTAMVLKDENSIVTDAMIHDAIRHLEDFKQLRGGIFFVDEIALTVSGKYKRNVMEEIAVKLHSEAN